jgi:hypothetical protein
LSTLFPFCVDDFFLLRSHLGFQTLDLVLCGRLRRWRV